MPTKTPIAQGVKSIRTLTPAQLEARKKNLALGRERAAAKAAAAVLERPDPNNAFDQLEESEAAPPPEVLVDPMGGAAVATGAASPPPAPLAPSARVVEDTPVVEFANGPVEQFNLEELVELQHFLLPDGSYDYVVKGTNSKRKALYHLPSGEVNLVDGDRVEELLKLVGLDGKQVWSREQTPEWWANRPKTVKCPWCPQREPIQHKEDKDALAEFGWEAADDFFIRKMTLLVHANAFHKPQLASLRARGLVTDAELSMLSHF